MKAAPYFCGLALAFSLGVAQASDGTVSTADEPPSPGAMAFDAVIVRPLGAVATVLGAAIFVLQLPFDIGVEGGVERPWNTLVVTPAKFTFQRPIGAEN